MVQTGVAGKLTTGSTALDKVDVGQQTLHVCN